LNCMSRKEFTEEVIVLRIGQFREIDCWVRFFSPSRGIVSAFAFGGYRSRRRFPGCLDILNQVMFKVVSNPTGKYFYLQEGSLLQRFSGISRNMSRLGIAVNCIKFLEAAHLGGSDSRSVYYIILNTLQLLNSQAYVPAAFPLLFRAKVTGEYGFYPNITSCSLCGKEVDNDLESNYIFILQEGKICCTQCVSRFCKQGIKLRGIALAGLEGVFRNDPSSWGNDLVFEKLDKMAMQAMDLFVRHHLGLIWSAGRFRIV